MTKQKHTAAEGKALRETGKKWLGRIEAAGKAEKNWLDDATAAEGVYTGEGAKVDVSAAADGVAYDFNILYSNVDTIVPAIINSPPAPDVRRRFGADDPAAKDLAEIIERVIRVQVDDGKLQTELEAMAQDAFLAGRGVIRVRFKSDFVGGETTAEDLKEAVEREKPGDAADGDDETAPAEKQANECIPTEAVSWKDYRHGPAKRWDDRPWESFRHSIQCEEYDDFADTALLDCQHDPSDPERDDTADVSVWEVWDKKSKTVLFIDDKGKVLKKVPDPLGLTKFFPTSTPMQPVEINGRLMPVNPFSLYRSLADELDIVTKRIRIITKQLKLKGWYGGSATDMQAVLDADDNEFSPIADPELWAKNGGIENAIAFWPVERLVAVLQQLVGIREQTKQAIYEITGISDIVRGASNAGETATAQNIKSQWGSLRIQKMVRGMERAAREIFIMMAEIIMTKFSPETIQRITGIQVAPTEQDMVPVTPPQQSPDMPPEAVQQAQQQAAQAEQARQAKLQHMQQLQTLMKEKVDAYYRVDVETDSTVKADLTRQKAESAEFMQASSAFFGAVAPLVQQGTMPPALAAEIYSSFARQFNLGKSVEDALDQMINMARENGGQPQQPDPAQQAAQAAAQEKQQLAEQRQTESQSKLQAVQIESQIKQAQSQAEIQRKAAEQRTQSEIDMMKARDESDRYRLETDLKRMDLNIKDVDLAIKQTELSLKRSAPLQAIVTGGVNG